MISPDTLKLWKEAAAAGYAAKRSGQEGIWDQREGEYRRILSQKDTTICDRDAEIARLNAEVESLRSGYLTDEHGNEYVQVCILKEKIREQEAEIERLRDALKFYRDGGNGRATWISAIAVDGGRIARAALAESEGK